ncbi:MAG: molybdopterin-dependent oxidoreductase [Rhizobiaceae bacterium]|nr:molybdopterin-dependent oxidoreductase [Rhizobiaceae bacterium]
MRATVLAIAATAALFSVSAHALDVPKERVVLTVSGAIDETNSQAGAEFDLGMLKALPGRSGQMETPWTDGQTRFEGPLLRALLDAVGAHGATLRITALNDYSAEVPVTDATDFDTMLAVSMNGEPMSVRDKGPIFMIYPFDTNPELYNEKYFSRSVWQIKSIEVIR